MDIPEECKIELKKDGYEFLKNLFNKYDKVNYEFFFFFFFFFIIINYLFI